MKKKIEFIAVRLAVAITLAIGMPSLAHAFSGSGSGTEADPYIITTASQLDEVRNDLAAHYKLGSDIDLGNSTFASGWTPIGSFRNEPFLGSLQGNGKKIKNIVIIPESYSSGSGLFHKIGSTATVRNLNIEGAIEIHFDRNILFRQADFIGALAGLNLGFITNVNVDVSMASLHPENPARNLRIFEVGAICGSNTGTITSSSAKFQVNYQQPYVETGGDFWIEGLGGICGENGGVIIACTAEVDFDLLVQGLYEIGGLSGNHQGSTPTTGIVRNCISTGEITMVSSSVDAIGGALGRVWRGATVESSSSSVKINLNETFDPTFWQGGGRLQSIGGFVGHASDSSFFDCSYSGRINAHGGESVGGFVGRVGSYAGITGVASFFRCTTQATSYCPDGDFSYEGGRNIGGFVGTSSFGYYLECYAWGRVYGVSPIGVFSGSISDSNLDSTQSFVSVYALAPYDPPPPASPVAPAIESLEIAGHTDTSISLSWSVSLPSDPSYLESDVIYDIEYRPVDGTWQRQVVNDTEINLQGLEMSTPYEIHVRSILISSSSDWVAAPPISTAAGIIYENDEVIVMLGARGDHLYSEDLAQDVVQFIFEEAVVDSLIHYVGGAAAASTPIGWLTFVAGFIPDALGGSEDPEFIPFTTYPMRVTYRESFDAPEWEPLFIGLAVDMRESSNTFTNGDLEMWHSGWFGFGLIEDRTLIPNSDLGIFETGNLYYIYLKKPIAPTGSLLTTGNYVKFRATAAQWVEETLFFSALRQPSGDVIRSFRGLLSDGGSYSALFMDNGELMLLISPKAGRSKDTVWLRPEASGGALTFAFDPSIPLDYGLITGQITYESNLFDLEFTLRFEDGETIHTLAEGVSSSAEIGTASIGVYAKSAGPTNSQAFVTVGADNTAHIAAVVEDVEIDQFATVDENGDFSFTDSDGSQVSGSIAGGEISLNVTPISGAETTLSTSKVPLAGSFDGWIESRAAGASIEDKQLEEDIEKDGLSNWEEYIFLLNPMSPDAVGDKARIQLEENLARVTYSIRDEVIGFTHVFEESEDLENWEQIDASRISYLKREGHTDVVIESLLNEAKFYRIKATTE